MKGMSVTTQNAAQGLAERSAEHERAWAEHCETFELKLWLRKELDAITEAAALLDEAEQVVERLAGAATGLSHGTDWNNGTHAKTHGYRCKLLAALPEARALLAKLHKEQDDEK